MVHPTHNRAPLSRAPWGGGLQGGGGVPAPPPPGSAEFFTGAKRAEENFWSKPTAAIQRQRHL